MNKITGVVQSETGDLFTVSMQHPIPMIKALRTCSPTDAEGRIMGLADAKELSENLRRAGYFLVKIEDVEENGKVINPYGY